MHYVTVPKVDVDEKYNVDEFLVSRLFRGNFTLQNPHSNSSSRQTHLQKKVLVTVNDLLKCLTKSLVSGVFGCFKLFAFS